MGWKSSDVVRFDLGPFFQGQARVAKLESAYNSLIKLFKSLLSSSVFTSLKTFSFGLVKTRLQPHWLPPALGSIIMEN